MKYLRRFGQFILRRIMLPVLDFVSSINWAALKNSVIEVLSLSAFLFLPFIAYIIIMAWSLSTASETPIKDAFLLTLIPAEIMAISLGFLSQTFFLIIKSHGTGFKMPFLGMVGIIALIVYVIACFVYVFSKGKWIAAINTEPQHQGLYFTSSLFILAISFAIWIYTVYHTEMFADYNSTLRQGTNQFVSNFRNRLATQHNNPPVQ